MAVPPSTPRKRARSVSSEISRRRNIEAGNTTPTPSPKKRKGAHRRLDDDQDLVEYLAQATAAAAPTTPPVKTVRTADENGDTIIVGKRKHQQFSEDLMDSSPSEAESEFAYPKISTPSSVKGFKVYTDARSPEVRQPASSTPAATSVVPPSSPASSDSIDEPQAQSFGTPAITTADDLEDPFLDEYVSDENADDEFSDDGHEFSDDGDEFSDDGDDYEDVAVTSDAGSEPEDTSVWIRKKTPYGIILAPKMYSDEEPYETPSEGRERLIGDDPSSSSDADSNATVVRHDVYESTHEWNEREEVVFRALVWDYGRNWVRFLPSLPHLTIAEVGVLALYEMPY